MAGARPFASASRARLAIPQIAAVTLILLLAVVITAPIIWSRLLEDYLVKVVAPPLESEFGFQATYEAVGTDGGRVFRLIAVVPNGRLARAGAHAGDIPTSQGCAYAGDYLSAQSFLGALERAAGGERHRISVYHGGEGGPPMHMLNFDNTDSKQ